jgi:hypothetical protein
VTQERGGRRGREKGSEDSRKRKVEGEGGWKRRRER